MLLCFKGVNKFKMCSTVILNMTLCFTLIIKMVGKRLCLETFHKYHFLVNLFFNYLQRVSTVKLFINIRFMGENVVRSRHKFQRGSCIGAINEISKHVLIINSPRKNSTNLSKLPFRKVCRLHAI